MPLRPGPLPRHRRPRDGDGLQLLDLPQEGLSPPDRPPRPVRRAVGRRPAHRHRFNTGIADHTFCRVCVDSFVLCAAIGPGQDRRQRPLPGRSRPSRSSPSPVRRRPLGRIDRPGALALNLPLVRAIHPIGAGASWYRTWWREAGWPCGRFGWSEIIRRTSAPCRAVPSRARSRALAATVNETISSKPKSVLRMG